MSTPAKNEKEVLWNASGDRARATLQLFRQQLQAHAQVPTMEAAPDRKSPAKKQAALNCRPPSFRPICGDC